MFPTAVGRHNNYLQRLYEILPVSARHKVSYYYVVAVRLLVVRRAAAVLE